jgi:hypothetical protein
MKPRIAMAIRRSPPTCGTDASGFARFVILSICGRDWNDAMADDVTGPFRVFSFGPWMNGAVGGRKGRRCRTAWKR